MRLFISTDKGLIQYQYNKGRWEEVKIHHNGLPIGYFHIDGRDNTWRVAINHRHWGPKIYCSDNEGTTWIEMSTPSFPVTDTVVLKSIWTLSYSGNDPAGTFYAGTEPAALFKTVDNGKQFTLNESLWKHPSKNTWTGGGKGSHDPFLHEILFDPEDKDHLYAAISCGGVFSSMDNGKTWDPLNKGIRADYLPVQFPETGQDPHILRICKSKPNVLWQQNHCGVYRSENKGLLWSDLSDTRKSTDYGFCMAIDHENENRAWIIPCQSDDFRIPVNNKLSVFMTGDGGHAWEEKSKGLPTGYAFDVVLRQGMDSYKNHLVFGSNNGNVYCSDNYGDQWNTVTQNLAPVRQVTLYP